MLWGGLVITDFVLESSEAVLGHGVGDFDVDLIDSLDRFVVEC